MDLALVGLVLPGIENLSLAVLARAAREDGREVAIVPFHGLAGIEACVARVLALRPRVCGISIQTSESILAAMCFTRILRARGLAGRIVCGGHFATLHARDILALDAGVDAVVRFGGERALVELLREPDADALAAIPGLVFRDRSGAIREGAPGEPISIARAAIARAGELPEHLGLPAIDLVASRGCESECAYCCVAGASRLAVAEARRAGGDVARARYERRGLAAIADEIATLHHGRGARVVTFMDDNVLPDVPRDAAAFARALRGELDRRGVGSIAVSLQLRADAVDDESADALVALGLARAYVGIDGYTGEHLRVLGRAADAGAGARAVSLLRARGVPVVCNALAIGPTVELPIVERIAAGLDAIRGAPVHLLPIEVRQGSALFDRAARRGLVEGSFLHRTYRFVDPRTALVARALFALPTRLRERSVPVAMYDLGHNLGIALRLIPELDARGWLATWDRIADAWNADQARALRGACAAAREGEHAIAAWIAREEPAITARDRAWIAEIDATLRAVVRAVSDARRRPVRAHTRSRLLGAVAFAMSLGACSEASPALDAASSMDAGGIDGGEGSMDAAIDGASDGAIDGAIDGAEDGAIDAQPIDAGTCADPARVLDPSVTIADGGRQSCTELRVRATIDADGEVVSFEAIDGDGGVAALPADVVSCLDAFFAQVCFPSAAGGEVVFEPHYWIA